MRPAAAESRCHWVPLHARDQRPHSEGHAGAAWYRGEPCSPQRSRRRAARVCAPCQQQQACPSEDAWRSPTESPSQLLRDPGRWPPGCRLEQAGRLQTPAPLSCVRPRHEMWAPPWGRRLARRRHGMSTQGWWHYCPPHGRLRAWGCRHTGQVTCLVSENPSRPCGGHRDQLPPPPSGRDHAARPPASQSQRTALRFRGAAAWRQVQSKQGPQRAAGHG